MEEHSSWPSVNADLIFHYHLVKYYILMKMLWTNTVPGRDVNADLIFHYHHVKYYILMKMLWTNTVPGGVLMQILYSIITR